VQDLNAPDAQIVNLRGGLRSNSRRRRAEREVAAIRSGAARVTPIVLFCHLRGESEPFPRRWRWGTLRLGEGSPVWKAAWLGKRRGVLPLPDGAVQAGPVRAVRRDELAAVCPNPRKSVVLPLDSPGGRIFVGLARDSVDTLVAALEVAARPRRS
jgi:hypothetical protein